MSHLSYIDDIANQDLGQYRELWPGKWPVSRLLRRKSEIGSQAFAQKYNSETLDDIGRTINLEKLRFACESNLTINSSKDYLDSFTVSSGMDLAAGKSAKAKFSVHLVLGMDSDNVYYVLYLWREKASFPRIKKTGLAFTYEEWNPSIVVVENNSMQVWLLEDIEDNDDYSDIPIMPFTTGSNKRDIIEGLPWISTLFEHGRIIIPYGDLKARQMMDPLIEELSNLPLSATTDCVMALWFALKGLKEIRGEKPGKSFQHSFMANRPAVAEVARDPMVIRTTDVMIYDEGRGKYRYRKYNE